METIEDIRNEFDRLQYTNPMVAAYRGLLHNGIEDRDALLCLVVNLVRQNKKLLDNNIHLALHSPYQCVEVPDGDRQ